MSLNWNLSEIKEYKEVCWSTDNAGDKRLNRVTDTLVWATMFVDLGEITEQNAPQFYARVHFLEIIQGGAFLYDPGEDGKPEDRYITLADVEAHIGLSTNVYGRDTDYRWAAKKGQQFMKEEIKKANWEREHREEQQPVA
jgi:hypothetical protein